VLQSHQVGSTYLFSFNNAAHHRAGAMCGKMAEILINYLTFVDNNCTVANRVRTRADACIDFVVEYRHCHSPQLDILFEYTSLCLLAVYDRPCTSRQADIY